VDSKETKGDIRRAAEEANRWGAKYHSVFLRDIIPETPTQKRSRSSSNEDKSSSKRRRTEEKETPRSLRSSRSPRPDRSNTEKDCRNRSEGRPREASKAKKNAETEELDRIKLERLEARRQKIERQESEDKATQEEINRQGKRKRDLEGVNPTTPIQTFKALNENENRNKDDWRPKHSQTNPEPPKRNITPPAESETESETQEGGTRMEEQDAGSSPGESIEINSDYEYGVEDEEEMETEWEVGEEGEEEEVEEEEIVESSPERRVTLRNKTATQKRRLRRTRQKKHIRERKIAQAEEDEQDTIVSKNKRSYQRR